MLITKDADIRFLVGRNGDHLITPFQCPLCHFRNIQYRDPLDFLPSDKEAIEFITRAVLDSSWSRETSTVESNLRAAIRGEKAMERFKFPSLAPHMGPFPLEDSWGMKIAVAILDRSFNPGLYEATVQFETFQKLRAALTNVSQAGVGGLGDVIGAYERNRTWISNVPTHSMWFATWFIRGLQRRHGQLVKQDWAPPIEVIHAIEVALELKWATIPSAKNKKRVAEMGVWFIVGFCSGLRGEEFPLIELAGTARSLKFLSTIMFAGIGLKLTCCCCKLQLPWRIFSRVSRSLSTATKLLCKSIIRKTMASDNSSNDKFMQLVFIPISVW